MADGDLPPNHRSLDIDVSTEALAALDDDDLRCAIMESDHPAAKRFARWLCHECLPAVMRGRYVWPHGQDAFDRMIPEAVNAVRPIQ